MKKNIKIVTFQRAHNYGAFLQSYALQYKLELLGYNVKIIDYCNDNIDSKKPISFYKKNNIRWTIRSFINFIKYHKVLNSRYKKFNNCIENNLNLTKPVRNVKELNSIINDNDIIITGSDQVWNPEITKGVDDLYTLNFERKCIKRMSYAASMGTININKEYETKLLSNISKLDTISIREESAKIYLNNKIKNEISQVLDPTLLLSAKEWNFILSNIKHSNTKNRYILAYDVAPNKDYIKIVNELSRNTNLNIIHFDLKKIYISNCTGKHDADPFEFLGLIKNAEYVVTTSFHATVFSIIFNKKFFVIPHRKTGERVTNLLDKFQIKGRTFYSYDEFKNIDYNFETDWEKVNKLVGKERIESYKWLENAIEKGNDNNE